jgi:hypothetical protein
VGYWAYIQGTYIRGGGLIFGGGAYEVSVNSTSGGIIQGGLYLCGGAGLYSD